MMQLDALAFGAHPDDVEISGGGTLHKLASLGYQVGICDCTRGESSTRGTAQVRAGEAEQARLDLGVSMRINLGLPDTGVDAANRSQLEAVVAALRTHRPRLVMAPYWVDQHPDHEEVSKLVTRAAFVAGLGKFGDPSQGRFRPACVVYMMFRRPFEAAFCVDITDSMEAKMKSIQAHQSQVTAPPGDPSPTRLTHPSFLEAIRARARFYGGRIGVEYAEAFGTREELAVGDPVAAFVGARTDRLLG